MAQPPSSSSPGPTPPSRSAASLPWLGAVVAVAAFEAVFGGFFPGPLETVGHDYRHTLPRLLAGAYWVAHNGWAEPPWFTPAFCGGLPSLANPQAAHYALQQVLATWVDPLQAVHATLLVFVAVAFLGTWHLLRHGFGASAPAALLGAFVFAFNGFLSHRLLVGHTTALGFAFVPLLTALVLPAAAERRPRAWLPRVLGGGVVVALLVHAGYFLFIPATALTLVAVALVQSMRGARLAVFLGRGAGALGVGAALSAARLVASAAWLAHIHRPGYSLPGVPTLLEAVALVPRLLFFEPPESAAALGFTGLEWTLGRHELEYGVGPAVAPLLLAWALARWRAPSRPAAGTVARWAALALVVAVPIALNVRAPAWTAFVQSLPVLGQASSFVRWLVALVLPVTVGAALAVDALVPDAARRWALAACAVAVTVSSVALEGRAYYLSQAYEPQAVAAGAAALRDTGRVPPIERIVLAGEEALADGASPASCYEASFGYELESFPRGTLRPGPVAAGEKERFNLKNPACYLFPDDNGCAPGDHFTAAQADQVAAFVDYRPLRFAAPALFQVARALQTGAWWGLAAAALVLGARAWRRRPASGQEPPAQPAGPPGEVGDLWVPLLLVAFGLTWLRGGQTPPWPAVGWAALVALLAVAARVARWPVAGGAVVLAVGLVHPWGANAVGGAPLAVWLALAWALALATFLVAVTPGGSGAGRANAAAVSVASLCAVAWWEPAAVAFSAWALLFVAAHRPAPAARRVWGLPVAMAAASAAAAGWGPGTWGAGDDWGGAVARAALFQGQVLWSLVVPAFLPPVFDPGDARGLGGLGGLVVLGLLARRAGVGRAGAAWAALLALPLTPRLGQAPSALHLAPAFAVWGVAAAALLHHARTAWPRLHGALRAGAAALVVLGLAAGPGLLASWQEPLLFWARAEAAQPSAEVLEGRARALLRAHRPRAALRVLARLALRAPDWPALAELRAEAAQRPGAPGP